MSTTRRCIASRPSPPTVAVRDPSRGSACSWTITRSLLPDSRLWGPVCCSSGGARPGLFEGRRAGSRIRTAPRGALRRWAGRRLWLLPPHGLDRGVQWEVEAGDEPVAQIAGRGVAEGCFGEEAVDGRRDVVAVLVC